MVTTGTTHIAAAWWGPPCNNKVCLNLAPEVHRALRPWAPAYTGTEDGVGLGLMGGGGTPGWAGPVLSGFLGVCQLYFTYLNGSQLLENACY